MDDVRGNVESGFEAADEEGDGFGVGIAGGRVSEDVGLEGGRARTWGKGRRERWVMGRRMPLFVSWAVQARRESRVREGKKPLRCGVGSKNSNVSLEKYSSLCAE